MSQPDPGNGVFLGNFPERPEHECILPSGTHKLKVWDVWQCECGRTWRLETTVTSSGSWMTWKRFERLDFS